MLVREHRSSGLIVARDSMDETSVGRALKQIDPRFVLQKHGRDNGWVYKVVCVVNDEQAPVVFTWLDDHGTPLPLSHALVDAVHRLHIGARNKGLGEDEFNHRLIAERARDAQRERDALVDDHRPYTERNRVSVSMSTGKPRYWDRGGVRPTSGKGAT